MKYLPSILAALSLLMATSACIEDGFTTAAADQPVFSTDTIDLGIVFTGEPTATASAVVRNPHGKSLNVSNIRISGENASMFRVNVDGISAESFTDMEIRSRDSIFVFVAATLPPNSSTLPVVMEASLDFTTNGVTGSMILKASGQNVRRMKARTLTADTTITAELPVQIFDSLVVAPGATLTLEPGTTLCFHDKASLIVRGTLASEGTPQQRVTLAGDRTGNVVGDISFDIMSRQWKGVFFTPGSHGNILSHTDIKNTVQGVAIVGDGDGLTDLKLHNSCLRNSAYTVLESVHARVEATGCEFAEGGGGLVSLRGGEAVFNHCTFANYYLFSVLDGPALAFSHLSSDGKTGLDDGSGLPYLHADISNSIVYGNGAGFSHGDLTGTGIFIRNTLIKGAGTDDDNFLACLWDVDPLYYTIREEYIFDYRLRPESPAIGAADPALTLPQAACDSYGLPRGSAPDLGAYVYSPPVE